MSGGKSILEDKEVRGLLAQARGCQDSLYLNKCVLGVRVMTVEDFMDEVDRWCKERGIAEAVRRRFAESLSLKNIQDAYSKAESWCNCGRTEHICILWSIAEMFKTFCESRYMSYNAHVKEREWQFS